MVVFSSEVGATLVPFGTDFEKHASSVDVPFYVMYDMAATQNLYLSFSMMELMNFWSWACETLSACGS
jgi:hypothetical protein